MHHQGQGTQALRVRSEGKCCSDQQEQLRGGCDGDGGHTLVRALEQVRRVSGSEIDKVFADRGYRGHGETMSAVYLSGQKRGITATLKKCIKRRQAIELVIGHLKSDGLLGRNHLKGELCDRMNAVLCGAGHNLRLVLARLRFFCLDFPGRFRAWMADFRTVER